MLLTYKENVHSTQMYIPLKPLFSRHKGIGVQFTDEPTGNLDSKNEIIIFEELKRLSISGKGVLVVSHNDAVKDYADRVLTMKDGILEHTDEK